jgi:hypothetical protein
MGQKKKPTKGWHGLGPLDISHKLDIEPIIGQEKSHQRAYINLSFGHLPQASQ